MSSKILLYRKKRKVRLSHPLPPSTPLHPFHSAISSHIHSTPPPISLRNSLIMASSKSSSRARIPQELKVSDSSSNSTRSVSDSSFGGIAKGDIKSACGNRCWFCGATPTQACHIIAKGDENVCL
jgi:hypothetical protein